MLKKIFNKLSKVVISLLMAISLIGTFSIRNVSAATQKVYFPKKIDFVNRKTIKANSGTKSTDTKQYVMINKSKSWISANPKSSYKLIYCIELGADLHKGNSSTSTTSASSLGITEAQKTLISRIGGRSGFLQTKSGDMSWKNKIQYLVGQTLIWEVTEGYRNTSNFAYIAPKSGCGAPKSMWTFKSYTDGAGTKYSATTIQNYFNELYSSWVSQIQKEIKESKVPSYTNKTESKASIKTMTYNEKTEKWSITIKDTNSVTDLYSRSYPNGRDGKGGNKGVVCTKESSSSLTFETDLEIKKEKPVIVKFSSEQKIATATVTGWLPGSSLQKTVTFGSTGTKMNYSYLKLFTDKLPDGKFQIKKVNEFGFVVPNVTFNVSFPNGNDKDYVTNSKGLITIDPAPYGDYVVQEIKAPKGQVLNDDPVNITVDDNYNDFTYTHKNKDKRGKISVNKSDSSDIPLSGVKFEIRAKSDIYDSTKNKLLVKKDDIVDTLTTNSKGTATSRNLYLGNYYVVETVGKLGFKLDKTAHNITLSSDNPNEEITYESIDVVNSPIPCYLSIYKQGEVLTGYNTKTHTFTYAKKKLAGMNFVIKAKANITNISNGNLLYKAGDTVLTGTTDKNGEFTTKLPMGSYVVQETKAPNGFIIDKTEYTVDLIPENTSVIELKKAKTITNQRQKVEIGAIKKDFTNGSLLADAEISLFTKTDIRDYQGNIIVKKDTILSTLKSSRDGHVDFKIDLPVNKYYLKETKAPLGYSTTNKLYDIDATSKDQTTRIYSFTKVIEDEPTIIEISKQDISTSVELEGAKLELYDEDNKVIDSWVSIDKPHKITKLVVGKTYILKEISAPYGYAISEEIKFTVKDTNEVQKIVMNDNIVFGQLKWQKTGEIFNQVIMGANEFGTTQSPVWNQANISGAEITIYALEDIVIGQNVFYKANEEIETLTSDLYEVTSKLLPVGKYYYVETKTPHGYITDMNKHYFEIKDNHINELQIVNSTLENSRFSFDVDMTKMLEEQKVFTDKNAYKDIVFGIFARNDIKDYFHLTAIEKDTMIATTGIDEEGHLIDVPDLPEGQYYLKELMTHSQYMLNEEEYDFEILYHEGDVSHFTVSIGNNGKIDNKLARGNIRVQKKDSMNEKKKLSNIQFNLSIHEDISDVLTSLRTDVNGTVLFDNLELGTYYIQEDNQIDGYILNDHIYKVEVKANREQLEVICENNPTEMYFSKQDFTSSKELEGAKLKVVDKKTGKTIDEWISSKEAHKIYYLVEGRQYIMTEITAPNGYEIAESIEFTAKDGEKVVMKDKRTPKIIKTGDDLQYIIYVQLIVITGFVGLLLMKRKNKRDSHE